MKKITDIYEADSLELTHSFQEACSDEEFKKYVYSLNIKEDIMIKYTSRLQEAYNEYVNCSKCRSLDTCKNAIKGYCNTPIVEGKIITFSYDECMKRQRKEKQDAYKAKIDLFDMPKDIKEASFKNIYKDDKARVPVIKYFKEFMDNYNQEEKPKGIYLNGSFGSGKTYLIASLFNEMAKKGINSILIYYPRFLRDLKASFNTDFKEKIDSIERIPLLLLDDIGAENVSNWSRDEVLGPILQYRMENNLPTFFTSNLTLEELEKALSITSSGVDKVKARRIISRIKQLTVSIELISKSRRN